MSVSSVIVLCSTGHRVTVSTTPGKSLMSVVEEVCSKRGLPDPSLFGLNHHGKPLDLSLSIRFSNLPNKAQLEMVKIRSEDVGEGKDIFVPIVFQLEDGTRLPPTTEVKVTSTILEALFLAGIQVSPEQGDPTVLYMRNETQGWEALQSTTIRALGINSDVKVLIRFFYKNAAAPNIRSSGSCSSSKKSKKEESVFSKVINYVKESTSSTNTSSSSGEGSSSMMSKVTELVSGNSDEKPKASEGSKPKGPSTTRLLLDKMKAGKKLEEPPVEPQAPEPVIQYLDASETVLAFDSSVSPRSEQFKDIDDAFFEHGIKDLQLLQESNKRALKKYQDNEAPLMTAKMRKAEEESQKLNMLRKYKKSVIRVQFPAPRRYILQIVLLSGSTIEELKERIKSYLKNPEVPFDLFVTPPRKVLRPEENLLDAQLVPASCVHFSSEQPNELKKEVLSKLSNYTGANAACRVTKRNVAPKETTEDTQEEDPSTTSRSEPLGSTSSEGEGGTNVPKWFKMGKQ